MTDIIALDVSMGRSNVTWYRQTTRLDEFMFRHTRSGFKNYYQRFNQPITLLFTLKRPGCIRDQLNVSVLTIILSIVYSTRLDCI